MYSPNGEAIRLNEALRTVPSGTRERKQTAPVTRRLERALQQHRDRHRTGPSGHRRQEARDLCDRGVDVAPNPLVGARQADVEARGTGLHHVGRDDAGATNGGDDDVGAADVRGEVGRANGRR